MRDSFSPFQQIKKMLQNFNTFTIDCPRTYFVLFGVENWEIDWYSKVDSRSSVQDFNLELSSKIQRDE